MNAIDQGPRWPTEYGDPAGALDSARGSLLLTTLDLSRQLAAGAGMAGSGAGAGDWAAAYDEATNAVLHAARDLIVGTGVLGDLVGASGQNYSDAEHAATIGSAAWGQALVQQEKHAPVVAYLAGTPPPSARGGDGGEPGWWHYVVAQLTMGWPSADTGALRSVAGYWDAACEGYFDAALSCHAAEYEFGPLAAPEILAMASAIDRQSRYMTTIALAFQSLASSCRGYADAVDQARRDIIQAGADLGWQVTAGTLLGVALTDVSLGGSDVGAAALDGWRVARVAEQVDRLLHGLLSAVQTLLGAVHDAVAAVARIAAALQRVATAVPVRVAQLAPRLRQELAWRGLSPAIRAQLQALAPRVSNKQLRHLFQTSGWKHQGGGFLMTRQEAQEVLDAVRSGRARILGRTSHGDLLVEWRGVAGYNTNRNMSIIAQRTHRFIIKGTTRPSVVPTSPTKEPVP